MRAAGSQSRIVKTHRGRGVWYVRHRLRASGYFIVGATQVSDCDGKLNACSEMR